MLNLWLLRCRSHRSRKGLGKKMNPNDLARLTALHRLFLIILHTIKIISQRIYFELGTVL